MPPWSCYHPRSPGPLPSTADSPGRFWMTKYGNLDWNLDWIEIKFGFRLRFRYRLRFRFGIRPDPVCCPEIHRGVPGMYDDDDDDDDDAAAAADDDDDPT